MNASVPAKKTREGRADRVLVRNLAVMQTHRRVLGLALVATVVAAVSVGGAVAVARHKVPPQYVPVTADGRLIELLPLNRPNLDEAGIASFTLEAVRAVNTYDYINWRDQLNGAQVYFSPRAWGDYSAQLQSTGTINAVQARKMVVSIQPKGPVKLVNEGIPENGPYQWRVDVPVLISFTAHGVVGSDGSPSNGSNRQEGTINLLLSRAPPSVSSRGVVVQVYRFTPDP